MFKPAANKRRTRLRLRAGSDAMFRAEMRGLMLLAILLLPAWLLAQPALGPRPPDPLMSLMMSQPRIDVTSPVVPTVAFEPPVVRPGEATTYRVTLNALEASIEWPAQLPVPPGLQVNPGGQGQFMGLASNVWQPYTTFLYHLSSAKPGQINVPEFNVVVYGQNVTIPAARLEVTPEPPDTVSPPQRLLLKLNTTNLFLGQSVRAQVLLPGLPNGPVHPLGQVVIKGDGFLVDAAAARPRAEMVPSLAGRSNVMAFIYETLLTPIATGKLAAFGQGYTIGRRPVNSPAPGIPPAGPSLPPAYILLDSDPVQFYVRRLPLENQLPGFTGAVGSYSIEMPELNEKNLRVGDPIKLTVRVRGGPTSNLARLVPPPPPRVRDWQVLSSTSDALPAQVVQAQGFAVMEFTMIPLVEGARSTPSIPFCYFDPDTATFKDLSIPPIPVTIQPGALPADLRALQQANAAADEAEKDLALSSLARAPGLAASTLVPMQRRGWFPVLQLSPAAAFIGLFMWDRRRRFLEQHPEIVLRCRARRALRREWRALDRAARAQDERRYAGAAVNAMRAACAPHYPAEPKALVGNDVLMLLNEKDRHGRAGEVVRRFFSVIDADRFSTAPAEGIGLLGLKPELELVLKGLEEKL